MLHLCRKAHRYDLSGCVVCSRDALASRVSGLEDELDALICERDDLREALKWCGGSSDFSPEGEAHRGWMKLCHPLLKDTEKP